MILIKFQRGLPLKRLIWRSTASEPFFWNMHFRFNPRSHSNRTEFCKLWRFIKWLVKYLRLIISLSSLWFIYHTLNALNCFSTLLENMLSVHHVILRIINLNLRFLFVDWWLITNIHWKLNIVTVLLWLKNKDLTAISLMVWRSRVCETLNHYFTWRLYAAETLHILTACVVLRLL